MQPTPMASFYPELMHLPWEFAYQAAETSNRNKTDGPGKGLSIQGLTGKRRDPNKDRYLVPVRLDPGLECPSNSTSL